MPPRNESRPLAKPSSYLARLFARPGAVSDHLSGPRLFAAVVLPVASVYLATTSWTTAASPDTFLNSLSAYVLAREGTVYLDDYENLRFSLEGMWIVEAPNGRLVSQYPVATALHGAVAYLVGGVRTEEKTVVGLDAASVAQRRSLGCPDWPWPCPAQPDSELDLEVRRVELPPIWPAALTAALLTAASMGFLSLAFRELASGRAALVAAGVAAFGTSAWSVAADELWQHTVAMFWISLAAWSLSRSRRLPALLGHAVAVMVRPLCACVSAGAALVGARRGDWRTVVTALASALAGAAVVVSYNAIVLGEPSVSGGYGASFTTRIFDRQPGWFLANFASGLLAPRYGLLVWSPFIGVLALGGRSAWRAAPDWVRQLAVGGALYLAAQWALNRASGGALYMYYRYPLRRSPRLLPSSYSAACTACETTQPGGDSFGAPPSSPSQPTYSPRSPELSTSRPRSSGPSIRTGTFFAP
ncbi:MAG: hypothetical protein KatS3mg008_0165 [Acidimicrobiales bacterium]|nr:MAG: hypothetical protein KatS3mg008_0165 [Acidimicrobiales bacterium]